MNVPCVLTVVIPSLFISVTCSVTCSIRMWSQAFRGCGHVFGADTSHAVSPPPPPGFRDIQREDVGPLPRHWHDNLLVALR